MELLPARHDPWLVAASLLIAAFASYVALDLVRRDRHGAPHTAFVWWAGGSLAMGTGIWSMHFVGMLAYSLPIALAYDPLPTAVSWIAAVAASGIALGIATRGRLTHRRLAIGSFAMAAAICAMHYIGMAAIPIEPGFVWDRARVAASAGLAIGVSAAALLLLDRLARADGDGRFAQAVAAAVMGAAVAGMHYTGMAAAGVPVAAVCRTAGALGGDGLTTLLVLSTSATLMLAVLLGSMHDTSTRVAGALRVQLQRTVGELRAREDLDPLTRLANRHSLDERLRRAIERCGRPSTRGERALAVLYVDLDGFRAVNDSFGHTAGDAVLVDVGARLASIARPADTVARVGADEFVMLVEGGDGVRAAAPDLARRAIDALDAPYRLDDGRTLRLSASVGVVTHPGPAPADRLVVCADAAAQAAKRAGGGTFETYAARMGERASRRLELRLALRDAIDGDGLALHYQPKIDARTGEVTGVEALLRWTHPRLGAVSPAEFVPVAERCGLIVALGERVIDDACRQLRRWLDDGLALRVALNVSALQLRGADFVERVEAALARHRVDPSMLLFEITETSAMQDPEATRRTFEGLGRIGVYLSIDDFGTGHSSLAWLRRLPARQLKIDRSFVRDLGTDADSRAIVDAIVRLAHALGLVVVAEGVETVEQRDLLAAIGCDELQGWLFAPAMPAAQARAWIDARAADASPAPQRGTVCSF